MRAKPLNVLDTLCEALTERVMEQIARNAVRNMITAMFDPPKRCHHPRAKRVTGPRVSATYGSWATEVCVGCLAWRYTELSDKRWHAGKDLVERLTRDREDDWS